MRNLFNSISVLLSLLIAIIVLLNISNTIILETSFISLKANVGFLILFCSILGSLVTMSLGISLNWNSRTNENKVKKQIEKSKLNYEIESDRVKQLEAKINTLEEALRVAIKK